MIGHVRRRRPTSDPSADMAYLRPIVKRLGGDEVHRLVDLIGLERDPPDSSNGAGA